MKNLSLLGILFLVFFSCRNDIDETGKEIITTNPPIIIDDYDPSSEIVEGTIYGKVYDENENPVADATVKYNGQTYKSDEEGRFFIINEALDRQGTFFTVEADGYFKGSRRIYPKDGSVNYAYVQLLALNNIGTFNAADGGEVGDDFGLGISFNPNSISASTGGLYNGPVTVAAKWLDPTADNIGEIMPGDLLGLNARVEEVSLVSYGMMAVELFDANGINLNIAEGNTATLSFPVPQELLGDAPAEIPLWSFEDEQYGIWAEEGKATLQGDKYVGQVSHFSFWNCDVPFPLVYIEGQLVTDDGVPLPNVTISIAPDDGTRRYGITDNRGFFAGKMPQGKELILRVGYQGEDCAFASINLGSFDVDANVGQVALQETGAGFNITGSVVDCDNNPLTNALVRVSIGNTRIEHYLEEESTFNLGVLNCDNANEVSITVVDLENLVEGTPMALPISPIVEFDTLQACGNPLSEFFIFTVDGKTSTIGTNLNAFFNVPETGEDLILSVGIGQDSTVIEKFLFYIYMVSGVEGTYAEGDLMFLIIQTRVPSFNTNTSLSCSFDPGEDCAELTSFEFNITENGGLNGYLGGNFSGTAIFTDLDNNSIAYTYSFSGKFRVPIK